MTYNIITDDMIDEMLNDLVVIKLNSYIRSFEEFADN